MSLLNVSLLTPLALLGLLALAVPLYLHMRHKPRAEIFAFPAIDFLLKAQKKRKRRFRVEQWLLMLFRMLIICLLAFLFSKPFIDKQFGDAASTGNQPLILLLDDSLSMMAGRDGERFFDMAVEQITDIVSARPGGSPTRLLMASNPEEQSRHETADAVLSALTTVKPTTYHATLDAAYQTAVETAVRMGWQQTTIRIFTDGSLTAWRDLPSSKPEKVDVIYTSLRGEDAFNNTGILSVSQTPGDSNSVEVALFNSNEQASQLDLRLQGENMGSLNHRMRVDAETGGSHRFGLTESLPATLTVSIPSDDFDLDNSVLFAPRANQTTRVLIVDGDTHPEQERNESFFFRHALGGDESRKYGFDLEVVTPTGMTREKIAANDVICLLNVDAPDEVLLKEAVRDGKGLFVSMGDRMDFDRWNPWLSSLNLEVWEAQRLPTPLGVTIRDGSHAMFPPITELEWQSYLSNAAIERIRLMGLGRAGFDLPLTLSNGQPLLLAKDLEPGRLMIWTSSVDLDWNDFPLSFGFVPFARQSVSWLASREAATSFASYTTNQVRDREMQDQLSLKYAAPAWNNLDIAGPKPGVYTMLNGQSTEFVQVLAEPAELDFRPLAATSEEDPANSLEQIGFRGYLRADLAPSIQWLLFLLILVETVVAARISLNWGSR